MAPKGVPVLTPELVNTLPYMAKKIKIKKESLQV